jgi:hypothetical protein
MGDTVKLVSMEKHCGTSKKFQRLLALKRERLEVRSRIRAWQYPHLLGGARAIDGSQPTCREVLPYAYLSPGRPLSRCPINMDWRVSVSWLRSQRPPHL